MHAELAKYRQMTVAATDQYQVFNDRADIHF
jgi:hypothetical protein